MRRAGKQGDAEYIMIMAGSASVANIVSRLEPIPPKLVPMSMPANARKKRALPQCRDRNQIRRPAEHEPSREGRDEARGDPSCGEDEIGRGAKEPGSIVGKYDLLADEAQEIAVG